MCFVRLYLTDTTGTIVYDYWALPIENPEGMQKNEQTQIPLLASTQNNFVLIQLQKSKTIGIAVDNASDPPRLYIVTDPSSPQGKQYLPIFYVFLKPEMGQGNGYKHVGPSPTPSIPCKGCSTVEIELVELRKQEAIAARRLMIVNVSMWVMVALSISFLILAILAGMVYLMNIAIRSKMGIIDSDDDEEEGGNNNKKKKKSSQKNKKKNKNSGYSAGEDGEFEMDVFRLADEEDEDEIALVVREDSSDSDQPQQQSCSVAEAPSSSSSSSPSEVVVEVEYEGGHHDNPEDAKETTNLLPPDAGTGI